MKLKQIISFFYLAIILVGTVGVNVFEHTCSKDGVHRSFFVDNEVDCSSHFEHHDQHKEDVSNHCCKSVEQNDCHHIEGEHCCDVEVDVIQIEDDYTSGKSNVDHQLAVTIPHVTRESFVYLEQSLTVQCFAQPPPKIKQNLQSELQVWII